MADPLSISASVAGLVSLAATVTQSCYGVYREIKNAPRLLKAVIDELNLLREVLTDLKKICDQSQQPLPSLDNITKNIQQCRDKLTEFDRQLTSKFRNPRGLLSRIRWSLENSEIKSLVNQLQNYRSLFDSAKANATLQLAMAIHQDVTSARMLEEAARKKERLKAILDWLSPVDFYEQQTDFYDVRREPGTSEWIESEPDFIEWRDRAVPYGKDYKRTMWCSGPPGSGKTIACSVLINNLLQLRGNVGVAYMYCSAYHSRVQMAESLVGSLARQFLVQMTARRPLPDAIEKLYETVRATNRPKLKDLVQLLRDMTFSLDQSYIVVDGLDEIASDLCWKLVDCALQMIPDNKTKFLVSSRPHIGKIARYLENGFRIKVKAQETDICRYLKSGIQRDENLELIMDDEPELLRSTVSIINQQCGGLFALARLHLQRISDQTNKAAIIEQLADPARSLEAEYDKGLTRMKKLSAPKYQLALRTMYYMAESKVPLTAEELQDALSVDMSEVGPDKDRRPPVSMIVGVCLGYVFENPITSKMEFFHGTVSQYLIKSGFKNDLELDLGGCCVIYLASKDLGQRCLSEQQVEERRKEFPFGSYASRFWGDRIRGPLELKHQDVLLLFLTNENRISCLQLLPQGTPYDIGLVGHRNDWFDVVTDANSFAIYTCAYLRLKEIMPLLLAKGIDAEFTAPLGLRSSPLHLAVKALQLEICGMLVRAGMNVNMQDQSGNTPLHYAWQVSGSGDSQIRKLLKDAGGRIDIKNSDGRNVLQFALQFGNTAELEKLIEDTTPSEVDHQDANGNTALHWAVTRGNPSSVKGLLAKDANPLCQNNVGKRPLDLALEYNRNWMSKNVVTTIQKHIEENQGRYSLLSNDKEAIATYLADDSRWNTRFGDLTFAREKTRFGPRENFIITATQEDAYDLSGHLLNGAKINFVDRDSGMTPLHHAILSNHELPVWHLLAAGADPDLEDGKGLRAHKMAEQSTNQSIAALFKPLGSTSQSQKKQILSWRETYHQVGRGMWSKRLSGSELETAYDNAAQLRERVSCSSMWSGPGLEIWYDYLGYREPEGERHPFVNRSV